jgi:hypothetical protein
MSRQDRHIRSIVIDQQARDVRVQLVRRAAVHAWRFVKEAVAVLREAVALARAARAGGVALDAQ